MTATATRQFAIEEASDFLSQGSEASRVDTQNCVIRGVRVLGLESRNTGRVLGLSEQEFGKAIDRPYAYSMEAVRAAVPLYENATVYSNHLKFEINDEGQRVFKQNVRENEEMIGWLQNVRAIEAKGLFADLHYIEAHPTAAALVEVAQRNPNKLALSHEAGFDKPTIRNGRIELMEITAVDGIALVNSKPGTTSGLFESHAQESHMDGEIAADVPVDAEPKKEKVESSDNARSGLMAAIAAKLDKADVKQLKAVLDSLGMSDSVSETITGTTFPFEKPEDEIAPKEEDLDNPGKEDQKEEEVVMECGKTMEECKGRKSGECAAIKAAQGLIFECLDALKDAGATTMPSPVVIEAMTKLDGVEDRKRLAEQFAIGLRPATEEKTIQTQPTGKKAAESETTKYTENPRQMVLEMIS